MSENKNIKKTNTYNEDQIQVLEGLEAVRKRPGMYIGTTSSRGLHHLVWEIVDNSIDEYLAGHGDEITVTIHPDNSISVEDVGRGIPVGMHKTGKPAVEVILTVLHAGGKFGGDDSGYKVSGGLHGVGSSVTNALSSEMVATIKRDGKIYQIAFEKGVKVKDLEVIGTYKGEETGSKIWFKPDPVIFKETTEYDFKTIYNRMRESALLNKGLRIIVIDEREVDEETNQPIREELYFENGIVQYVELVNNGKKVLHDNVIYIRDVNENVDVEVALQYHDDYGRDGIYSFANNIKTPEGGTHETGFKTALTNSVKEYIQTHDLMKGKKELPNGDDTRSGLTAIVTVKVPEPQFEGQTKSKLGNSEVSGIVNQIVSFSLTKFFEENPETANAIIGKIIHACEIRIALKKQRELEQKKRKNQSSSFSNPEKLAPCRSKDKDKTELYLVEGDSAGGSAKQGRDKEFQAILPLRGKVINTERAPMDKINENNEITAMRQAIGTDIGDEFDYEKRRYNKIVIMTDADVDGAHISILLLTFFYRYMKPLIERGHVFMARPPLYKIQQGKKITYAYSDKELNKILDDINSSPKPSIQRYKGLGEMNPTQLWETTMDPEKRTLFRVNLDDAAEAEILFTKLMGDDPFLRKEHIQKYGHEANIDA